ncbi:DUF342 domain-containing protein [Poriferisphaera sp. WC338]|uniref:DUF342 domain-containing protein n=1 Tax=Poriferisphaera sp. WC338 TaxID=3425129 RepID=UPI003D81542C
MSQAPAEQNVRAVVSADKTTAELVIAASIDRELINEPLCMTVVMEAGIEVSDDVNKQMTAVIKKAKASRNKDIREVISRATPAVPGVDGTIDWFVDQEDEEEEKKNVSHYERSAFVVVQAEQIIGKQVPASLGTDGRDVTGKTILAKEPLKCIYDIDESILVDSQGQLIAQVPGVLVRDGRNVSIEPTLVIEDNVDFATGNIDFSGDVEIRQDIRDCFVVKAEGNITVNGFVEDATILAGKNITVERGYSGRTRAEANAGGNMVSKYLDNVDAIIQKDLLIAKEIIGSRLTVHGRIDSPGAIVIGGETTVTRDVNIASLGSEGGTKTILHLGAVPLLEPFQDEFIEMIELLEQEHAVIIDQIQMYKDMSTQGNLAPSDMETQTQCMFTSEELKKQIERARSGLAGLSATIDEIRLVDLNIGKHLYLGVEIICRKQRYMINSECRGPLNIKEAPDGTLVMKGTGKNIRSITEIASVTELTNDS